MSHAEHGAVRGSALLNLLDYIQMLHVTDTILLTKDHNNGLNVPAHAVCLCLLAGRPTGARNADGQGVLINYD